MNTNAPLNRPPLAEPRMFAAKEVLAQVMAYQQFVPRLQNLAKHFGFDPNQTLPARALCSDESQGPVVSVLTSYFGTYPFDLGRVGGMIATGRSSAAAHHGKNLILLAATHVGFDPSDGTFGQMFRPRNGLALGEEHSRSTCCGKLLGITREFENIYEITSRKKVNLVKKRFQGEFKNCLVINNVLLARSTRSHVVPTLNFGALLKKHDGEYRVIQSRANSKVFEAGEEFLHFVGRDKLDESFKEEKATPIGRRLTARFFHFEASAVEEQEDGSHLLAKSLLPYMNRIVTDPIPPLAAANIAAWEEFDKAVSDFRVRTHELGLDEVGILLISGFNLDVYCPKMAHTNPLLGNQVYFFPIAAYLKNGNNPEGSVFEREEIGDLLAGQSPEARRYSVDELSDTVPVLFGH